MGGKKHLCTGRGDPTKTQFDSIIMAILLNQQLLPNLKSYFNLKAVVCILCRHMKKLNIKIPNMKQHNHQI